MFAYNIMVSNIKTYDVDKHNNNKQEQLLEDNPNRFVLFPIQHQKIWDAYKKELACFWSVEEVDLSKD